MRDTLRATVNPDGGWGYYPGTASRLEPTCWAGLALLAADPDGDRQALVASTFFVRGRRGDGLIIDAAEAVEDRPNLAFNAMAALLLTQARMAAPAAHIVASLAEHKGAKLPDSKINRQDNSLQGWGWIDDTFSWVEPTCWCLIALKKLVPLFPAARARIDEAERLLADRCCSDGGWNYGNANMLGQQLRPYVPTTALALVAMQDRPAAACVVRSLEYLSEHRVAERSAMALALASLALRVFGKTTDEVDGYLVAQWDRTRFLGNNHLTAMALYSLTADRHGVGAFRV